MRIGGDENGAGGPRARSAPDRLSLATVLTLLRAGDATRQEIEAATALGRAIVADRLATLEDLGLIEEGPPRRSLGGRAPRTARLCADAGCVLVATIDRDVIGVGLADVAGRLIFEHHEAADIADDPDRFLRRIYALFDWVLAQQERPRPLWAIGVGVPSIAETRIQDPSGPEHLGITSSWTRSRALDRLIVRHRVPVFVRSTIQMATMGEFALSSDRSEDLLFIDLGSEINAGLVSGGRLHRGALGIAGQLGHVRTGEGSAVLCRCGNVGCLETVASAGALLRAATQAAEDGRSARLAEIQSGPDGMTVADIGLAAQLGDAAAAEILARAGRAVGTAVSVLANMLNPARIVLGGEVAETGEILLAAFRETLYRHSHPMVTRDLAIVRSRRGRSAGLAGTALAIVEELLSPDWLAGWITGGSPLHHSETPRMIARAQEALEVAGLDSSARRSRPAGLDTSVP